VSSGQGRQDTEEEISRGCSEGPGVETGTNIADAKPAAGSVIESPRAG